MATYYQYLEERHRVITSLDAVIKCVRSPVVRELAMRCNTAPDARLLGFMGSKLADGHWVTEV